MKLRNALLAAAIAAATVAAVPAAHAETRLAVNGARPFTEPWSQLAGGLSAEEYADLTNQVGANWLPGSTPVPVEYPATAGLIWGLDAPSADEAIAQGRDTLLVAIKGAAARGERVVVAGLSEGTIVLDETLTHLATDSEAPSPDTVSFVLFASPNRGIASLLPAGTHIPVLGFTTRANPDSQYDVSVVFGEYDGWADFPDRPWNLLADVNALFGAAEVHTATALVSQADAVEISSADSPLGGTTTTYMVPTPQLPLTGPLRSAGVPASVTDGLDKFLRPIVDAGYSRNDDGPLRRPYLSRGRLHMDEPSDSPSSAKAARTDDPAADPSGADSSSRPAKRGATDRA